MESLYKIETESHMGYASTTLAGDANASLATEAQCRTQDINSDSSFMSLDSSFDEDLERDNIIEDVEMLDDNVVHMDANIVIENMQKENFFKNKKLGKLRDLRKELRESKRSTGPDAKCQVGLSDFISVSTGVEALSLASGVDIPDWIVSEIESVLCLFTSLSGQGTTEGAFATIVLWLKTHFSQSICKTVVKYLKNLLQDSEETQVGVFDETPNWLRAVREARMNWHMCRNNKAFGQLSKLLGLLVTMGLCKASALEFRLNEFVLFAPKLYDKHAGAFGLLDATFETVLFFVEGIYLCFTTRSLKPLLVSDHSALQLDEEYARIMSWWDLVKVGNLQRVQNMSDQEFEQIGRAHV